MYMYLAGSAFLHNHAVRQATTPTRFAGTVFCDKAVYFANSAESVENQEVKKAAW